MQSLSQVISLYMCYENRTQGTQKKSAKEL